MLAHPEVSKWKYSLKWTYFLQWALLIWKHIEIFILFHFWTSFHLLIRINVVSKRKKSSILDVNSFQHNHSFLFAEECRCRPLKEKKDKQIPDSSSIKKGKKKKERKSSLRYICSHAFPVFHSSKRHLWIYK